MNNYKDIQRPFHSKMYALILLLSWVMGIAACGTTPAPSKLSTEETLGETIYGILCDMVVTGERITDARGHMAWAVCHEDQEPQRFDWPTDTKWDHSHNRIHAMWANRGRLVSALDSGIPTELHTPLRGLGGGLLSLFDQPLELLPHVTRALATSLYELIEDPHALKAMQKLSARAGYTPLIPGQNMMEATVSYPQLQTSFALLTETLANGGIAHEEMLHFLEAAALEMATEESDDDQDTEGGLEDVKEFILTTENSDYDIGKACWVLERDSRGMANPSGQLAGYPAFADTDNDGLVDIDEQGRYLSTTGEVVYPPSPFPFYEHASGETNEADSRRDPWGRLLGTSGTPFYEYINLQTTVLSALIQEAGSLLGAGDSSEQTPAILDAASALPMIIGDEIPLTKKYGNYTLDYKGYDAEKSPLVALVDGISLLMDRPEFADFLGLLEHLMVNEEKTLVSMVQLADDIKALDDVYPDSELVEGSPFYDELMWFLEITSRHIGPDIEDSDGDGVPDENQLEALIRAMADPAMKHFGTVGGVLMRYKDLISINPVDINDPPVGTFMTPVDRTQNDYLWFDQQDRVVTNRSIMERLVGLISELDGRGLCNKESTLGDMMASSAMEMNINGTVSVVLDNITVPECGMIQFTDMVRVFAQVAAGEFQVSIGTGWMSDTFTSVLNSPLVGSWAQDLANGNLEQMTGIDGFGVRPTPDALARLVFQPAGGFRDATINPMAAKPYHLETSVLPYPDRYNPPKELRITHYYKSTMFAMEPKFEFEDGTSISFFDGMVPLALAINRHDVDPEKVDASILAQTEAKGHLFGQLLSLFAHHWPSKDSDELPIPADYYYGYQDDPTKPYYGALSDLANTEEFMAAMISGNDLVTSDYFPELEAHRAKFPNNANAAEVIHNFFLKLSNIDLGKSGNGIKVMSALMNVALNPHVFCTNDGNIKADANGRGACHDLLEANGGTPPADYRLISRLDGSHVISYNSSGDVFDGSDADHPLRPLSVARILQKAVIAFADAGDKPENAELNERFTSAVDRLKDVFFKHDGERFTNRRAYSLAIDMIRFARNQIETKRNDGTLSTWAKDLPENIVETLRNPIAATGLKVLTAMANDRETMKSFGRFFNYLFGEEAPQDWFVAALASVGNGIYSMDDSTSLDAFRMATAKAMVPNIQAVVAEGALPAAKESITIRSLEMSDALWKIDSEQVVSKMAQALLTRVQSHANGAVMPMSTIIDVMGEVNRATPNVYGQMYDEDYETWFSQLRSYLGDKRSGLERVISVIENR